MKLACFTVFLCFNYSTSFSNDGFPSFENSTEEGIRWHTKFKLRCHNTYILPWLINPFSPEWNITFLSASFVSLIEKLADLQTFIYRIKNKSKSCETQARSPSHRFTGKSEQNITTKIHAKKGWRCDIRRDILVLFVAQCTLVKSGVLRSG